MNIFVCVKQVPDTETKITPSGDGTFIETSSIKWIMNPYDEFAVEQALLLKAANAGSTVTVLRVGSTQDTEALRTALAMGADEAILVEGQDNLDSYMIAKSLKGAIEKSGKNPDILFTGKQAIDDDCLQVPQLLAQMIDMPSVSVVVGFESEGGKVTLKREVEGGALEVYEVNTPVVVACNKGINTPRYASLPGIMKAKKKPLQNLSLADVGVSGDDRRVKYSNFQLPPEKPPGKKFDAMDEGKQAEIVAEVVQLLRNEAKVI
ncbi:MAG: electron transfer flavoprotein subunit beta/FixA family protein [Bacteriovoracaceae bacterium]|nr:electron transfer flavoprotein subunit beta/FixA family protein [Bacteriovoracaceae bacterium]